MQAIVFEEFGGPEVLQLKEVEEPHAGPGEVRIAVQAIGVNPVDFKVRRGWFEDFTPTPLPSVPGVEAAGIVDEVGEGVTGFVLGDEVVGWVNGGAYAEHARMATVIHKPAEVSWEQAVALPQAGETADRVLRELDFKKGETLLLHGAAGVVGALAVQLAVARGGNVIGTASPANHDYLRGLGAVPVAYGEGLVERVRAVAPQGVDAVFDAAGFGALPDSIKLRGGTDRIVTIADMGAQKLGVVMSPAASTTPEEVAAVIGAQLRGVADGTLRVRIDEVLPLAEAAKAQQKSEGGHARGKLVLVP
ncbi:NADP-dependent oxidoreductase [Planotetraspora mira]|uniref:NADPH:quinone reductase n=1 Tax=Planotetraspora mira TaxID=58121 RepID=A0A8J3TYX5_9ACTN|nr:NADP-dependent oxidoreductase [Planotetraspora mira]GII34772.1 NADPH:quinone reductase [Planotetraspora mira]